MSFNERGDESTSADLIAENDSLRAALRATQIQQPGKYATLFVSAAVGLSVVGVVAIVVIFAIRPERDNTGIITTILGFILPLITASLGGALQQVHTAVNSRLSELLALTQTASRDEGRLAEQRASASRKAYRAQGAKQEAYASAVVRPAAPLPLSSEPLKVEVINAPLSVVIDPDEKNNA